MNERKKKKDIRREREGVRERKGEREGGEREGEREIKIRKR